MKAVITSLSFLFIGSSFGGARISKAEYVEQWKETAIQQMILHKIPASITLAQGILESASGNSTLAIQGKNHFGIKCHGWTGDKIYLDDDKKDECFRVYASAADSYSDHSAFLKKYERYAFLFSYDNTDYNSWAKGLKKAGYATNPKYPDLLIGIIEDLNLSQYDKAENPESYFSPKLLAASKADYNTHKVHMHETNVPFIIAQKGDTYYKVSKEFRLTLSQLYKYNNFCASKDVLEVGDVVYIRPIKMTRLLHKKEVVASSQMSLEEFSQVHAVRKKVLMRLNKMNATDTIFKGDVIVLGRGLF
jgi:uncharacterized FlgJ-related protein